MNSSMKTLQERLDEVDVTPRGLSYNHPTDISRRTIVKGMAAAAALAGLGLGYASSRLPPAYAQENKIVALTSMYPVTIDGKWTNPEEWTDTYDILGPGNVWKVKHTPGDGGYIQALFDFMGDTKINASPGTTFCDTAVIRIDTLSNGGNEPQPDDFAFKVQWLSPDKATLSMQQGTGSGWKDVPPSFSGESSMDASNDPNSTNPHLIYEVQIPKSILPPGTSSVRCRLATRDGQFNLFEWPIGSYIDKPYQWGELELSQNVIPEFPDFLSRAALLTFAIGAPFLLLKRYSKRRSEIESLNKQQ